MRWLLLFCLTLTSAAQRSTLRLTPTSPRSLQQALDDAPAAGLTILLAPGTYNAKLSITHPGITLVGTGPTPADTVLQWHDSSKTTGATSRSATLTVSADRFEAENLTILNTWWTDHPNPDDSSQAVALYLSSDRAVLDRVRLLSGQDTLFANSLTCRQPTATPCNASREFFNESYIEGHIDYIFGDALAVFNACELHSRQHPSVMITAQSRHFPEENSGYTFLHSTITGTDDGNRIVLGRPWRPYSTVTFFDTDFREEILPEGWWDWDGRLKTATYREYDSHGPGANLGDPPAPSASGPNAVTATPQPANSRRAVLTPPLTPAERAGLTPDHILAGPDHWSPESRIAPLRALASVK